MKSPKLEDAKLSKEIERHIKNKTYRFMPHSQQRSKERGITEIEVLKILNNGWYRERKKDEYKEEYESWNYAIRGKTIDDEKVRIAISFDENNLLIITVIKI